MEDKLQPETPELVELGSAKEETRGETLKERRDLKFFAPYCW